MSSAMSASTVSCSASDSVKPDLKKINPVEGAKKIFSIRSLVEFPSTPEGRPALPAGLVDLVGNPLASCGIPAWWPDRCGTGERADAQAPMLVCVVGFLAIAAADYAFERHQHYKQLRTSKDEEEVQGDGGQSGDQEQAPAIPSGNCNEQPGADVRRSSVIVANPDPRRHRHTLSTRRNAPAAGHPGSTPTPLGLCGSGASPRKKRTVSATNLPASCCCATAMSTSTYRRSVLIQAHRRSPALAGKPADGYAPIATGQGGRRGTGDARRCDLAPEKGARRPLSHACYGS
ncbi:EscU/YscU/HrcU family type III secretion system export apparatus switch protein [Pseudomonas aeruginosa]